MWMNFVNEDSREEKAANLKATDVILFAIKSPKLARRGEEHRINSTKARTFFFTIFLQLSCRTHRIHLQVPLVSYDYFNVRQPPTPSSRRIHNPVLDKESKSRICDWGSVRAKRELLWWSVRPPLVQCYLQFALKVSYVAWRSASSALYQLHLVKAEVARRVIPPELKVVQAFGYTLGGFYLAKYDSSPAGVFDELVVLAGIVWNPPTSCAWAARVIVNSEEARDHGIDEVGLPSRTAEFSLRTSTSEKKIRKPWWNILPKGRESSRKSNHAVDIVESDGSLRRRPLCNIELLNNAVVGAQGTGWQGPSMKMSLPSFSGKTEVQPDLLKYSCRLSCRIRPVSPARVSLLPFTEEEGSENVQTQQLDSDVMSVLIGKPLVALAFEDMAMFVEAPSIVVAEKQTLKGKQGHGLLSRFPRFKAPGLPTSSA